MRLRMEAAYKLVSALASASSAIEVQDHHHHVRLGHPVIFIYNMSIFGASWDWGWSLA